MDKRCDILDTDWLYLATNYTGGTISVLRTSTMVCIFFSSTGTAVSAINNTVHFLNYTQRAVTSVQLTGKLVSDIVDTARTAAPYHSCVLMLYRRSYGRNLFITGTLLYHNVLAQQFR